LEVENEEPYGVGIFVDIYPIDFFAKTRGEVKKIKKKASRYSSLCFLATRKHFSIGHTSGALRRILKLPAFVYAKMFGGEYFKKKLDKIQRKYYDVTSNYIGCLVWGSDGEKGIFERKMFDDVIELSFEGKKYYAPVGYDGILSQLYGDYLQLPAKDKQVPHHDYKAYRKEDSD